MGENLSLFGTRDFIEVRNEFRGALQCGAREMTFRDSDGRADAIRLLAAASNGVPVSLGDERLTGLRKGDLRLGMDWARLFVANGNGVAFPETLIVRENGTAMFARCLPGFPAQATLDVLDDAFNEMGDGLRGTRAAELDRLAASLLLNPWSAVRVPAEGQIDFHSAHVVPGAKGGVARLPDGAPTADLLLRSVSVSLVTPDPEEVQRARDALMALLDYWHRSRPSCDGLYAVLESAGRTDVGDAAFERALDGLPKSGQEAFGEIVDALIDAGHEWDGFLPRLRADWTYRGDWVVKWMRGRGVGLDPALPKYQRLLRAWGFVVNETARLLDLGGWAFTPGLLVGDDDYAAELSEWGGKTFALLNPKGIRVSAPLGETVLALRDRAAHIVAHVGGPSHDERWARRYGFILESSIPLLAGWQRQLHWLSSYGASIAAKNGG